jgi:hypothetical protein
MSSQPLFPIGKLVMTCGVADTGFSFDELLSIIRRHITGDFGIIDEEGRQENFLSIREGYRILSAYKINDTKLWVITEADRSVTTILFPEEY